MGKGQCYNVYHLTRTFSWASCVLGSHTANLGEVVQKSPQDAPITGRC